MRAHAASLLDPAPSVPTFRTARDAVTYFLTLRHGLSHSGLSLSLSLCLAVHHKAATSVQLPSFCCRILLVTFVTKTISVALSLLGELNEPGDRLNYCLCLPGRVPERV